LLPEEGKNEPTSAKSSGKGGSIDWGRGDLEAEKKQKPGWRQDPQVGKYGRTSAMRPLKGKRKGGGKSTEKSAI